MLPSLCLQHPHDFTISAMLSQVFFIGLSQTGPAVRSLGMGTLVYRGKTVGMTNGFSNAFGRIMILGYMG